MGIAGKAGSALASPYYSALDAYHAQQQAYATQSALGSLLGLNRPSPPPSARQPNRKLLLLDRP